MYSEEEKTKVLDLIAEGLSLRQIEAIDGMPNKSTVISWVASDTEFHKRYARAKEMQAEVYAEEIIDIADDARNDWMERLDKEEKGIGWQLNGEHVQRSRLRIESRKWLMGKLKPKKYGDKVDVNHGNQDGKPFEINIVRGLGDDEPSDASE